MIRAEKLAVVVELRETCASACVLVLAAGTSRRVHGTVGILRPYLLMNRSSGPVTAEAVEREYSGVLQTSRAYLREMGAAEKLADDMLRIEPNRMRLLTRTELEGYGIGDRRPRSRSAPS
jgi:hypothetical protein